MNFPENSQKQQKKSFEKNISFSLFLAIN